VCGQVQVSPVANDANDAMHARTGTEGEGEGAGSDESNASSEGVMNEELGVCHDGLGYEKRFELRQCKRMQRGI